MIYSVGNRLGNKLTGIEKAMINRHNLFKNHSITSKLILHRGHLVYILMQVYFKLKMTIY